jgi:hypothetical protein
MRFAIENGEGMFGAKEDEEKAAGRTVHNEVVIIWYT